METTKLNREAVKTATNASHTATITMIVLGFRQRAHNFTNLPAIKHELQSMNEKVVERDFMEFWKNLEAAGVGSLVIGRRGKATRFEWDYSLRQIAQLAIGDKVNEIDRLAVKSKALIEKRKETLESNKNESKKETVKPKLVTMPQVINAPDLKPKPEAQRTSVYTLNLEGTQAQIILPFDISKADLQRVKDLLKQL